MSPAAAKLMTPETEEDNTHKGVLDCWLCGKVCVSDENIINHINLKDFCVCVCATCCPSASVSMLHKKGCNVNILTQTCIASWEPRHSHTIFISLAHTHKPRKHTHSPSFSFALSSTILSLIMQSARRETAPLWVSGASCQPAVALTHVQTQHALHCCLPGLSYSWYIHIDPTHPTTATQTSQSEITSSPLLTLNTNSRQAHTPAAPTEKLRIELGRHCVNNPS